MINELSRAKHLLQNAGYHVIPREDVHILEAVETVRHVQLVRYAGEKAFVPHLLGRMAQALSNEIRGVMGVERKDAPMGDISFRVRLVVIDEHASNDPLLEMLREEQMRSHPAPHRKPPAAEPYPPSGARGISTLSALQKDILSPGDDK